MTREEAINKVRQMSLPKETMEILEALAPELAESEDERMIREIKRYIKEQGDKPNGLPNGTVAVADMIAWLEKQKDYVSNNFDDVWDEEDCEEIIAEGQKLTPRFKELLKEVCHAWYDRGAKLEKQKEQKPLHWRRIEDATTQRTDDGCCVTSEKMLVKGWINDEDYRIVDEGTMVNRDILCIPVRELNAEQKSNFDIHWENGSMVCEQKEQKPIKMEVYEVGKGTTICGQDYKCKKDYKEGNCWYIKDAIYHCGRDGYLTDQNGVSWSCTPEWFKEYIQSNTEWAEEEKTRFVSGQFLQCKLSFEGFKEGEHYWLEYVGDDMYVGRSDNILNQKFHITPRQLYTLFSQQLEEVQGPSQEEKQVSLNYEPPFNENPSDKEIIEALIKHLKEQDGFLTAINCVSTKAILSWLKKQKEQKHPNGCFTCDEYKKGYEEGRRNGFTAGYNKAMKEVEQKEQKPAGETNVEPDSKIPREEYLYHLLANHIITFTDYTYLLAKKPFDYECANIPQKDYTPVEQKSADLSEMMVHKEPYITPVPTPMVADEQKPEWSEEDKQNLSVCLTYIKDTQLRDWLIEAFHKSSKWSDEDKKMLKAIDLSLDCYSEGQLPALVMQISRERDWLKSLPERFNLHPKQEWSEEDEKTIDDAFCWLCEYAGSLIQKNYGKSSMLYGIANKLKSLRPQYHGDVTMTEAYKMGKEAGEASRWKPTEHQMTILKAVKEYVGKGSGYWGEELGSLINDLEKL